MGRSPTTSGISRVGWSCRKPSQFPVAVGVWARVRDPFRALAALEWTQILTGNETLVLGSRAGQELTMTGTVPVAKLHRALRYSEVGEKNGGQGRD